MTQTQFDQGRIIFLPKCHSTNDVMARMSEKGILKEGDVVITDHQYAGKGRRGHTWEATPGKNLTFSLFLRPEFLGAGDGFFIVKIISLALIDYLKEETGSRFTIKWPNDIYYEDRKIAGILISNNLRSSGIQSTIAGIGLNVNQTEFPEGLHAISLNSIFNRTYDLNQVFNGLLKKIDLRYAQLKKPDLKNLKDEYLKAIYGFGENHECISKGRKFVGIIEDIGENGKLILNVNGKRRSFDEKEISFIK